MRSFPSAVEASCRAALVAACVSMASGPALAQDTTDYMKQAGNFLANCDPRPSPEGDRPEPNFVCLSFVAGLIEGYNYAAVANGNPRPYCLVRPTSLVEMMDMMVTVIERGIPEDLPTAAVFHFILTQNFPCTDEDADDAAEETRSETGAGNPPEGTDTTSPERATD